MDIKLKEISIRDISANYKDNSEEGVLGFNGLLNIRPPYQREFVYDEKKRNSVIETVRRNFPLNVMYWVVNENGTFEVLDGQQRTISICQFINNEYSIEIDGRPMAFHNLQKEQQDEILDYKLMVYHCSGTQQEKIDWFRIINIAGVKLTDQEIRNAVYSGPWLSHAKTIFSKTNCAAYGLSSKYVSGSPIRQEILEKALEWISKDKVDEYMSKNQMEQNANELWSYFQAVINWVSLTFTNPRPQMKSVEWGYLYDNFKDKKIDTNKIENRIKELMMDDDVTDKKGIYYYVLTNKEKHLSIREFTAAQKTAAYERQNSICMICKNKFAISDMEADHITPWSQGGKTVSENCQLLCREDNRRKSSK